MKGRIYFFLAPLFGLMLGILYRPVAVFALDKIVVRPPEGCHFAGAPGFDKDVPSIGCLSQLIVNVVDALFLFLGAVALVFILFASIRFIISRGDPKAIQSAQKTLTYAILGTVLILLAFFFINTLTTLLGFPNILQRFGIYQGP